MPLMIRVAMAYVPYPPVRSASALPNPPTKKAVNGCRKPANNKMKPSPRFRYPPIELGSLMNMVVIYTNAMPSAASTISLVP